MKFSIKWLKEHLDFDCSFSKLSEKLTSLGLEVESFEDQSAKLSDFLICKITSVRKHPNADKLKICNVYDGTRNLQIVCGASNARKNLVTVLANIGTVLPSIEQNKKIKIKKSKIRDVYSEGMLCAWEELGIESKNNGIIELDSNLDIGKSAQTLFDDESKIFEVAITPNRVDCAGVQGIARDLQAGGLGKLKNVPLKKNFNTLLSKVVIKNHLKKNDCPQFELRLIKGVENKESPNWLKKRFRGCGIKIISYLVDVTNYLTFDSCRPLHVFDFDKIKGEIIIRHSLHGEKFKALDGLEYTLEKDMIVICDDIGIISLAGIMGGERTACDFSTKNVLLESAYFNPEKIAYTGRKLKIDSDARYRFERGIDPNSTIAGLNIAANMIKDFCGGDIYLVNSDKIHKEKGKFIRLNINELNSNIGFSFDKSFVKEKLELIGCKIISFGTDIELLSPSWRHDLRIKEDLYEEVARLYGYEKIPNEPMKIEISSRRNITSNFQQRKRKLSRTLVSRGFSELVTWSFVDDKYEKIFESEILKKRVRISNPISTELSCMRSNLVINILKAIKKNQNRGYENLKFFEIGPIFFGSEPNEQELHVAAVCEGNVFSKNWLEKKRQIDLFDIKSDFFSAIYSLGLTQKNLTITNLDSPSYYHPKQCGNVKFKNRHIGFFGMLNPNVLKKFDLESNIACFEINLSSLNENIEFMEKNKKVFNISKYQSSVRDFSFILDRYFLSSDLIETIKKVDIENIKNVSIFDCFEHREIGLNKKALAVEVFIQSNVKTLNDEEIEKISEKIVNAVKQNCNGKLRV